MVRTWRGMFKSTQPLMCSTIMLTKCGRIMHPYLYNNKAFNGLDYLEQHEPLFTSNNTNISNNDKHDANDNNIEYLPRSPLNSISKSLSCFMSPLRRPSNMTNIDTSCKKKSLSRTPRGYLALYVGEERRRFLLKANMINHPLFAILLEKANEEFGFDQEGAIRIPCDIAFFEHIMLLVESNN